MVGGDVGDLDGAVRGAVVPNLGQVVRAHRGPGQHQEAIRAQAGDGQIAVDAASLVQHRGIDNLPGRAVHLIGCDVLQKREGARGR